MGSDCQDEQSRIVLPPETGSSSSSSPSSGARDRDDFFLAGTVEDMCYESVCVFITAGPIIKLCAGGEGDSEGHVL
jgi:hypothetical protein